MVNKTVSNIPWEELASVAFPQAEGLLEVSVLHGDDIPKGDLELRWGRAQQEQQNGAQMRDREESKSGLASPNFFCHQILWQIPRSFTTSQEILEKFTDLRQISGISRNSGKFTKKYGVKTSAKKHHHPILGIDFFEASRAKEKTVFSLKIRKFAY